PRLRRLLPAVGAADVGPGVGEVLLLAVEDDAGDETAAVDTGVLPGVRLGRDGRPGGGLAGGRHGWRARGRPGAERQDSREDGDSSHGGILSALPVRKRNATQ